MAANVNKGNKAGYSGNNNQRQATGYLNIYAPGATGRRKLGAIFLFDSQVDHAALIEYLEKDAGNAKKLHSVCEFEYNPNKPDEEKQFVLPD